MCDTFVALAGHTADGSVVFGKNSDRPPNEAQALEYHARRDHPPGAELSCTHVRIPQVRQTHALLVCRPHWMWGAEMGANEHGVVVGNEAVFTRVERSREPGLIGTDLVRLALERARTAHDALRVITELLARHGQGGLHGPKLFYHSSFLLADPREAWVLETAGDLWAASRVRGAASLSNVLTIGEEIDEGTRSWATRPAGADCSVASPSTSPAASPIGSTRPSPAGARAGSGRGRGSPAARERWRWPTPSPSCATTARQARGTGQTGTS